MLVYSTVGMSMINTIKEAIRVSVLGTKKFQIPEFVIQ